MKLCKLRTVCVRFEQALSETAGYHPRLHWRSRQDGRARPEQWWWRRRWRREDGTSTGGRAWTSGERSSPTVLPEPFDGVRNWWFHFENVSTMNGWDDSQKLQWLRVCLTGRAQKALHRLPGPVASSYEATRDALKARFEPESRHTRYQAEFQTRRKKAGEGWAEFADELRSLADKAYPDLQEEARERLSLNAYLSQLPQPQIPFSVRQKQPTTLDDAVAATLEMESYLPPQTINSTLRQADEPEPASVDAVSQITQLVRVVGRLAEQVEKMQLPTPIQSRGGPTPRMRRRFAGACWNCQRVGHMARDCPLPRPQQPPGQNQGN